MPSPFDTVLAPGPKQFDAYIGQVSFAPERTETVDLSEGYYFNNQAIVARKDTPITEAKSIADLANYRFGAQVGTTSLATIESVITPKTDPSVYNSNDAAIAALNGSQIDAIVVDLPTAFYIRDAQMDGKGAIVGQLERPADQDAEYFSVLLPKDSPLTDCVNQAIAALQSDGRLDAITEQWLTSLANAPVLQP